jgi:hypothetical protein
MEAVCAPSRQSGCRSRRRCSVEFLQYHVRRHAHGDADDLADDPGDRRRYPVAYAAAQNLPYFDMVNKATVAANAGAQGRDFIDALVAAGFQKRDMQLTPDTTSIGLKANSIQFSVQLGDTCLIGQYGADAGGYESTTSPTLATGGCLIGQTRPIDW